MTGNYTKRQNAPTASQLGDAIIPTDNVPIFDYITGKTVNIRTISGGNPNLDKGETQSFRVGVSINPLKDPQLNFQFDLSHNRTTGALLRCPRYHAGNRGGLSKPLHARERCPDPGRPTADQHHRTDKHPIPLGLQLHDAAQDAAERDPPIPGSGARAKSRSALGAASFRPT